MITRGAQANNDFSSFDLVEARNALVHERLVAQRTPIYGNIDKNALEFFFEYRNRDINALEFLLSVAIELSSIELSSNGSTTSSACRHMHPPARASQPASGCGEQYYVDGADCALRLAGSRPVALLVRSELPAWGEAKARAAACPLALTCQLIGQVLCNPQTIPNPPLQASSIYRAVFLFSCS